MNPGDVDQRLSQISTTWSLLARAHGGATEAETAAQAALVERYQSAVYRYLLAAVRDLDQADELFQEFALRLVRGDFGRADPRKGRFRDYVKSALINLVINHKRKQKNQPVAGAMVIEPTASPEAFQQDEEFLADWRKALLDRAWESLAGDQEPSGPPFHTVLRLRSDHPDWTGTQLAEQVNNQLQPSEPFTEAGLRKILQRAREKFTDFLVDEVARSLRTNSLEEIELELIDLGFQAYCRRALERRREK